MGILNYQCPFIRNFAHITQPINNLLKKGTTFIWTEQCHQVLDNLINAIMDDPALTTPNPEHPFELETNASDFAVGAVLFQHDQQGKQHTVGYAS